MFSLETFQNSAQYLTESCLNLPESPKTPWKPKLTKTASKKPEKQKDKEKVND